MTDCLVSFSEVAGDTARKQAARRLALLLVPLLDEPTAPSRSELARRLNVGPPAITMALAPDRYDTSLPLLYRIAEELGYEPKVSITVDARVALKATDE